ncbi:hypothetical protein BKA62DRAFT_831109 [Auriculariales sp. MPI-PUGE-AT-0066]|nr:hypothetical protein BKA62DRAFT_831109 [Auriculariales sp. MPI-PUGE-AT-0066]
MLKPGVPLHELIFYDGDRELRAVSLPEEVLLGVFNEVRLEFCHLWSTAVPFALYRDIRPGVESVRVSVVRGDTEPSNWRTFSSLKRTLDEFALSSQRARVLDIVESLRLDVQCRTDEAEGHMEFCDLEGLAQILLRMPRLKYLQLTNRQTPVSLLPRNLQQSLSLLSRITHIHLAGSKLPLHNFIDACPLLTHILMDEPVGGLAHTASHIALDVLGVAYDGFPSGLDPLALLSRHITTLFLHIIYSYRGGTFDLAQIFPPTLKTVWISVRLNWELGQPEVFDGLLIALRGAVSLRTIVIDAEAVSHARLVEEIPPTVRRLGVCVGNPGQLAWFKAWVPAAISARGKA